MDNDRTHEDRPDAEDEQIMETLAPDEAEATKEAISRRRRDRLEKSKVGDVSQL